MLSPLNSSHDDHLKHLLDQRSIRADLPGYSSTFSQVSDTPSVYSRTFSPRPTHSGPVSPSTSSRYTPSAMSGRRTNLNRLNDPAVSMLDLDEDRRSSIASSDYYADGRQSVSNDDDDPLPRMSLLGPKMRFHSRAPWEMEEADLQEEDEPDYETFISTAKRGFGFSSPRASSNSRPSGESTRSQVNSQKSFETTPSQRSYSNGALTSLPQDDLSTSLDRQVLRGRVSLDHIRPDSLNESRPSTSSLFVPDVHSPAHSRFRDISSSPEHGRIFTSPHPTTSRHRRSSSSAVHPYANPDLVSDPDDQHSIEQGILRTSDSMATVTDSITASTLSKSNVKHARVPMTSIPSVTPKHKASTIHGKEISSPITVLNTGIRPGFPSYESEDLQSLPSQQNVTSFSGWSGRGAPPTFGLISLEEARAQRARSVTADSTASRPLTSTQVPSSTIAFPIAEPERVSVTIDRSGYGQDTIGARVRSISAGSKAKNAGQPKSDRRAYEPGVPGNNGSLAGRTLKHKKSGFMRLFNGARQDKEEKPQPPPVPSLSDVYLTSNVQQVEQNVSRATTYRVPVPELSVPGRIVPQHEHSPTFNDANRSRPTPSPKRPLPLLSIDTLSHSPSGREANSSVAEMPFRTLTMPASGSSPFSQNQSLPQTAPAYVSEFPALKLRPMSTLFSAQFGDHVINDPRLSLDTDFGTTDSSSNILSPTTPNSLARSDLPGGEKTASHEQVSTMHAPQEQIVSNSVWQRHIWELESQVRDLKAEMEELRAASAEGDYCHACGRGKHQAPSHGPSNIQGVKTNSVVHRPRARTGTSSRFASAVS